MFQRLTHRFGWRAYALPLLVVITVVALINLGGSDGGGTNKPQTLPNSTASHSVGVSVAPSTPPVASGNNSLKSDEAGNNALESVLASGALPAGVNYTAKGDGTFRVLKGTSGAVGSGQLRRYSIDVENGITGVDLSQFAEQVQSRPLRRQELVGPRRRDAAARRLRPMRTSTSR